MSLLKLPMHFSFSVDHSVATEVEFLCLGIMGKATTMNLHAMASKPLYGLDPIEGTIPVLAPLYVLDLAIFYFLLLSQIIIFHVSNTIIMRKLRSW